MSELTALRILHDVAAEIEATNILAHDVVLADRAALAARAPVSVPA